MAYVLVLTRQPYDPFTYKTGVPDNPRKMQFAVEQGRFGKLVLFKIGPNTEIHLERAEQHGPFEMAHTGELEEVAHYKTIERIDHNMVIMPPRREPYFVTWEPNNRVVKQLGPTQGHCFRVHGGKTQAQQGILIHAAPHVGWLTGCISPRGKDDRTLNTDSTYHAMDDLYRYIGNDRADFFITDW